MSSVDMMPFYSFFNKGKNAMLAGSYYTALYNFNLANKRVPFDKETLFYKAICEINLNDIQDACIDLHKLKELGGNDMADSLVERYCK
ncbi:MAG TPA: hypothetical protein VGB84_09525 [Arachidicoccus sp.]